MYGTARIDNIGDEYFASFAPGEDPVFFAHKRLTTTGSEIRNIGVGTIDNDGHYW